MAGDEGLEPGSGMSGDAQALAREWKRLARAATFVAVLTSPVLFALLYFSDNWSLGAAILGTFFGVIAFRGLIDVLAHRVIPRPSLQGADKEQLLEDATARRRIWYWQTKFSFLLWTVAILGGALGVIALISGDSISGIFSSIGHWFSTNGAVLIVLGIQLPFLLVANVLILFGPLLVANLRQMRGYEPGDANWGVKLSDVRGLKEPKEEVTRVISLWQSGEQFRKAGGKPERGLLFIGAPGTGKTMLSKAIATSFNSPIVTMPGSGFAATFIGIDVIVVMMLIRKARRLARKWGGQCIIFIDEIDAVGMRRQALGQGAGFMPLNHGVDSIHDLCFYGPLGSINPSGDLIIETEEWREKLFRARAEQSNPRIPAFYEWLGGKINHYMFPGMFGGGGGMALNQLLVQMDGITEPPVLRKFWTNRLNNFLDATYVVPRKIGSLSLRAPAPKPRSEQIYFIGATNVPITRLDPALLRPGRMGRHIWFRTPNKDDRKDILALYMDKVAHDQDLDSERRRDELARIMGGYSPAMIEQVCSMALILAHADARPEFAWSDFVRAMATVESGTMEGVEYEPDKTQAVAIHEAGHAAASHVYMHDVLSTRLSIRKRGGSLGHHAVAALKENFGLNWRHEEVGDVVWGVGSLAAEHVFYGENSTGVAGDLHGVTVQAATMVGIRGMGPEPIRLNFEFDSEEERLEAEKQYMDRFERIGTQLMNRSFGQVEQGDPIAAILRDPNKYRAAAQILGQAYITAYCLMKHNKEKILQIADVLMERREMYGDEVVELLEAANLEAPAIDVTDEATWPRL